MLVKNIGIKQFKALFIKERRKLLYALKRSKLAIQYIACEFKQDLAIYSFFLGYKIYWTRIKLTMHIYNIGDSKCSIIDAHFLV